jgi:hypothetical protein
MIFRRIKAHVAKEDWFAVFIDFLIVVFGVFMGFQVQAWNETRGQNAEEVRLLSQLRQNTADAIAQKQSWVQSTQDKVQNLRVALDVIQNNTDQTRLTEAQCYAVWRAHIVYWQPSQLVTLEEIISTGGLGLLSDQSLRTLLMEYRSNRKSTADYINFIRADTANVVDHYPEAFTRKIDLTSSTNIVDCDLPAIRASKVLQNKLLGNIGRTGGLITQAQRELSDLTNIQKSLGEDAP